MKKSLIITKKRQQEETHIFVFYFRFYYLSNNLPPINTIEYSNELMILLVSFISSFEINKVKPFSALTLPFHLFLFQIYLLHLKLNCLLILVYYL